MSARLAGQPAFGPALSDLPAAWRARADELRRFAAEPQAVALECAASDLERALAAWQNEALTLSEASAVSGYSADYLGTILREKPQLNAGRKGAPRIRRRDLPIKAAALPAARTASMLGATRMQIARAVANSDQEVSDG